MLRTALAVVAAAAVARATGVGSACLDACNDGVHICDPRGECNLCMPSPPTSNTTYKCLAGCGGPCSEDGHCGSAGCGSCVNGTCTAVGPPPTPPGPAQTCLGACNDGVHLCGAAGECNLCIPVPPTSNTTYQCGAGCGGACTADANCLSGGCGSCVNGTCTASAPPPGPVQACNGPCKVNTDCDTAGECGICVPKTSTEFWCSAPCTKPCTDDSHCGVANCMHCTNGTCGAF